MEQEQTQLEADKVYLQECIARVEETMTRMSSLSDDELEQLEREGVAIESEKERIREDEEKLNANRDRIEVNII